MRRLITVIMIWLGAALLNVPAAAGETFRVAIVDRFYPPVQGFATEEDRDRHTWLYGMLDLDDDEFKEPYYHGDIVRLIASDPRFIFVQYPLSGQGHPMADILRNLRVMQARQATIPVDALILSWESSTLVSAFDVPLSLGRVRHYKDIVRQWGDKYPEWRYTHEIILALEALVAEGVMVFTISGNGGRGMVNTFSFAEGVRTVGSIERELQHFIADNPFVDMRTRAAYQLTRVDNPAGKPLGYDIDGDGCVDIPLSKLTARTGSNSDYPRHYWKTLKGSSFAAPAAMKGLLLEGQANSC